VGQDVREASTIDGRFVPVPRPRVAIRDFGSEAVLADPESGQFHLLNPTGALVWRSMDGVSSLDGLALEFADAFSAPADRISGDVVELTRSMGRLGLLEGIAAEHPAPGGAASGFPVGHELESFRLPAVSGSDVDLADLRDQEVLLINWSPSCGYCRQIAPELGRLAPSLRERGIGIVLLSDGGRPDNRLLLEEAGLEAPTALRGPDDATEYEFADPFPDMGTPVAYLLDGSGRVAEPLATGADEVLQLCRAAAGIEAPDATAELRGEDADPGPDDAVGDDADASDPGDAVVLLVPPSEGLCKPSTSGKAARVWTSPQTFRFGRLQVGVRGNSGRTADLIARMLRRHRVESDIDVPASFSLVLTDEPAGRSAGGRDLNLLLFGNTAVVRSRSPRRVLAGLVSYLSSAADEPPDELLVIQAIPALVGGRAVLLPDVVMTWLDQVQSKLARAGVRLVDAPRAVVDPASAEVVVTAPSFEFDASVLEELPAPARAASEAEAVPPGRYPLAQWFLWDWEGGSGISRARTAAAAAAAFISVPPADAATALDRAADLTSRVPTTFLGGDSPADLVTGLRAALNGHGAARG